MECTDNCGCKVNIKNLIKKTDSLTKWYITFNAMALSNLIVMIILLILKVVGGK